MISDLIKSVSETEDEDVAYLVAGAINLYGESVRRRAGRILYGPGDVRSLFAIISTLLAAQDIKQGVIGKARSKPSPVESDVILKGLEREMLAEAAP